MSFFVRMLRRLRRPVAPAGSDKADETTELDRVIVAADALRDAKRPADAVILYRAARDLAPGRADLVVQLGNMLKDSGQVQEAVASYRSALALSEQADTYLQLGHALKALGDRAQALDAYRRALTLDPDNSNAVQELAEAGDRLQQARRFDSNLRGGGVEALLTLSQSIACMRAELQRMSRTLPEAISRTALPIALYDTYRTLFPVPAPPGPLDCPLIIVLLADRETVSVLFRQVAAIQAQSHSDWSLSVVGSQPDLRRVVELAAVADQRVRWVAVAPDADLAQAERAQADGTQWVLLLAKEAVLDQHAAAWFAQAISWGEAQAYICDEETGEPFNRGIRRSGPVLRQVVDYDTLLEANVFGETVAVHSSVLRATAPELSGLDVAEGRAAMLRNLARTGRIGHVPYPLVWREPASRANSVTRESFKAAGPPLTSGEGLISVIVATRDNAADLEGFIGSLRQTAADPAGFEIVVMDNGTSRADDLARLRRIADSEAVRVVRFDTPFNWSYLNNQGADLTASPYLLFANDDMRMVSTGWDARLRALLVRSGVGAVGARLLFDDDTIQHGGILFGWQGSVIHDGLYEPVDGPSPTERWHVTRGVGAVTGAFLAIRREYFLAVGKFDATNLPVAYSDVDLALKLRAAGLRIVWTPGITLYHAESKTRGADISDPWRAARNEAERALMQARWGAAMEADPGLHPAWHAGTLPFRLLASPSSERVRQHIVWTAAALPWTVTTSRGQPEEIVK